MIAELPLIDCSIVDQFSPFQTIFQVNTMGFPWFSMVFHGFPMFSTKKNSALKVHNLQR